MDKLGIEEWPAEIRVVREDGQVRYVFPARRFWLWMPLGVAAMVLGGVGIVGVVEVLLEFGVHGRGEMLGYMLGLVGFGMVVGKGMDLVWPGHVEFEISPEELEVREVQWWRRREDKIAWARIRRVEVERAKVIGSKVSLLDMESKGEAYLRLWTVEGPRTIGAGYPRAWLRPMAGAIEQGGREAAWAGEGVEETRESVVAVDLTDVPLWARDLHERPDASRIEIQENADRMTVRIPASGALGQVGWYGVSIMLLGLVVAGGLGKSMNWYLRSWRGEWR